MKSLRRYDLCPSSRGWDRTERKAPGNNGVARERAMARIRRSKTRVCLASASLLALAACADGFDVDKMRAAGEKAMTDLKSGLSSFWQKGRALAADDRR